MTQSMWSNWSGSVQARPQIVLNPASIDDVVKLVQMCRQEGRRLRVVGSGHSFTPIAASEDCLVSLDHMQGLVHVDTQSRTAKVWAGTKLKLLGELLFQHGLAQENLGDIDVQSIAGAISTGTHGTGRTFGNISTQVVGFTVVTGTGEVMECTAESDLKRFKALQVSLGTLGIIVQITLRLEPAYRLEYVSRRVTLDECLQQQAQWAEANRHFEFYWFPYALPCQIKTMNLTQDEPKDHPVKDYINEVLVENTLFGWVSELCRKVPQTSTLVSRFSASQVPLGRKVHHSHKLFATQRLVRFNEMEYNLPAEAMNAVIEEMRIELSRKPYRVHFPVECRYAKGDDIWLSPAYGRDSAYIAIHMYRGMPHAEYFNAMERIFLRYGGRPHWGKMHSLEAAQLQEMYPMWESFQQVRHELDPDGIFLNDYVGKLFGITNPRADANREIV
ncbi:D-arabinono-1,4-lactone oxidase [Paenibacillus sp. JCM 10914]|uniref:D-arabinono-1,4-lactone oxidase n=1 Tax=Paenibacillus sp. JCM 10914 TaxID=1236974 RepID=UPI0003CC54C6|nr:D-arabinono-1,4-lactone oxidase [Paenibacillus sp. JCM 10914]GAE06330.1 oxidoreductase, FAD-binding [Paenibacillus sp. JCM 10914]